MVTSSVSVNINMTVGCESEGGVSCP